MLNTRQFRDHIIIDTLNHLQAAVAEAHPPFAPLHTRAAVCLVLATGLAESGLTDLVQRGGGPARGLFQIEPATHTDLTDRWLNRYTPLYAAVTALAGKPYGSIGDHLGRALVGNLHYQSAICRLIYYRRPEPLPDWRDVDGMAAYWKQHYNTPLGAGTVDHFAEHYERALKLYGAEAGYPEIKL